LISLIRADPCIPRASINTLRSCWNIIEVCTTRTEIRWNNVIVA